MAGEWLQHDGGPNPAPGRDVSLVFGIGVIDRQPSDLVNWSLKWQWRLADSPDPREDHPTREGIFRSHSCWRCGSGAKPCAQGAPNRCEYPRARND